MEGHACQVELGRLAVLALRVVAAPTLTPAVLLVEALTVSDLVLRVVMVGRAKAPWVIQVRITPAVVAVVLAAPAVLAHLMMVGLVLGVMV